MVCSGFLSPLLVGKFLTFITVLLTGFVVQVFSTYILNEYGV